MMSEIDRSLVRFADIAYISRKEIDIIIKRSKNKQYLRSSSRCRSAEWSASRHDEFKNHPLYYPGCRQRSECLNPFEISMIFPSTRLREP